MPSTFVYTDGIYDDSAPQAAAVHGMGAAVHISDVVSVSSGATASREPVQLTG